MAGWGSNNKFALLGGMRGVAQMVSYEIPQVMSVLPIVLLTGSMSMQTIVAWRRYFRKNRACREKLDTGI